jgi:GcrA cell cycle regulator
MPRRAPVLRQAMAPIVPVIEADPLVDEHGNHATVLTISDRMCKWPIGDPASNNFHFCGHKPKEGSPYCEAHCVKAFQPAQSRRDRDREREYRRFIVNG